MTAEERLAAADVQNTIRALSCFIQAMNHDAPITACNLAIATEGLVEHYSERARSSGCHCWRSRWSAATRSSFAGLRTRIPGPFRLPGR